LKKTTKAKYIIGSLDILLVGFSFIFSVLIKPGFSFHDIKSYYLISLGIFIGIWIVVSHFSKKFIIGEKESLKAILSSVLVSNFIILAITSVLLIIFTNVQYSRIIIFGTIFFATIFELIIGYLYHAINQSEFLQEWIGPELVYKNGINGNNGTKNHQSQFSPSALLSQKIVNRNFDTLKKAIIEESGKEATLWITSKADIINPKTLIQATTTRFNIDNQPDHYFETIINLARINDIQRINKFFESVNTKLADGGVFIGCGETYLLRKERILNKYPAFLNYMIYTNDFIFKRVVPKMKLTRKLYFLFSRGKNRVMSKTETLGRLYSCGFEVIEEKSINHLLFWKAKKIKEPAFDYNPTYGIFIRLKRVGKKGKVFNVYKFRTMHAYSEYVQAHIYQQNSLDIGGKFKDDYRVTTIGKILRKFWLDELPMFINVIKGDLKIVGVRPLSQHFYNLYRPELQQMRIKYKPGLIPPYYAQFPTPTSLEETQENEQQYLSEYEQHPLKTDIKYFFKAMHNIFIKRARSK
jgi:lipopolysaccharide/colanic/teichoic acid biosynthesis glycosyltransferase